MIHCRNRGDEQDALQEYDRGRATQRESQSLENVVPRYGVGGPLQGEELFRRDLPVEAGTIIAQTPQGGERVDCGTVIGVTISAEAPGQKQISR